MLARDQSLSDASCNPQKLKLRLVEKKLIPARTKVRVVFLAESPSIQNHPYCCRLYHKTSLSKILALVKSQTLSVFQDFRISPPLCMIEKYRLKVVHLVAYIDTFFRGQNV